MSCYIFSIFFVCFQYMCDGGQALLQRLYNKTLAMKASGQPAGKDVSWEIWSLTHWLLLGQAIT